MKFLASRCSLGSMIIAGVLLAAVPLSAQKVNVDISACRGMYEVLKAMRDGASVADVSKKLDSLLETSPYRLMFKHYNRSWRPHHLPETVFKRMLLSLQFEGQYAPGENERADAMRIRWTKFYPDLSAYERRLRQLLAADLSKLIQDGVSYAQGWLPPGWTIPDFYFPIVPNGGSPAFTIEGAQGYDFLQLAEEPSGELDLNRLTGTIAHESHHLGMRSTAPDSLSPAGLFAYRVVGLCVAEGVATEFISGPPAGRAPAVEGVPFHIFDEALARVWLEHVKEEDDILKHQVDLLDQAVSGRLNENALSSQLRDYWLSGTVGRAYVLGADMFGAIYLAFGKKGVFSAMMDPRRLFEIYNAALDAKPEALARCVRVPDAAVRQALAIK